MSDLTDDRVVEIYNDLVTETDRLDIEGLSRKAMKRERGAEYAEAVFTDAAFMRACKRIAELETAVESLVDQRDWARAGIRAAARQVFVEENYQVAFDLLRKNVLEMDGHLLDGEGGDRG